LKKIFSYNSIKNLELSILPLIELEMNSQDQIFTSK